MKRSRRGFTLLELLLSLALIVLATGLIGALMQIYSSNFATRGEDIRRVQLARGVLNMIAEDIRAVVLEQEYDQAVLEQLLGASGGGGGGDPNADPSGAAAPAGSDLTAGDPGLGDFGSETGELSETVTTSLAPGIYGNQFQLLVDVSRVPRPDEYFVPQTSLIDASLADVPGDMKTVTYFVQAPTNQGVADDLSALTEVPQSGGFTSGLVRRQLDRAVTAYAEEVGDTDRLLRTGDLVAPEVLALEFSYFDGTEWLLEWDSSMQSLPWLVQISLAMQSASGSQQAELEPGTSISAMTFADRQLYGIEVYELVVAIPGAQLTAGDAVSADQAAGMESLGL